jgi:uncharacterized protein (DUF1015 family)
MATLRPFCGLCPNPSLVEKVASPPYDVLDSREAKQMAENNPQSFLHVIKPEIDLPDGADPYGVEVYEKGAENLQRLVDEYVLLREKTACFYLYQQIMGDHVQTGFVGLASVDDYLNGDIKKHEHTRPEKVNDRVRLIKTLNAQTGPVFLAYKQTEEMADLVKVLLDKSIKMYDFVSYHDVRHIFYKVDYEPFNTQIQEAFARLESLYIADGHHRSEGASMYCKNKRDEMNNISSASPYCSFLTVTFPDSDMMILPYNRAVQDLNGHSGEELLQKIAEKFEIKVAPDFAGVNESKSFGMYLNGEWHLLTAKPEIIESDAVKSLDVSILQDNLLFPLLDIDDPRTNTRINFVGGIKGDEELKRLVDSGEFAVAFSLAPTTMQQVMDVADAGKVMPPKSTWFEPKLLSGLATHILD